MPPKKNPRKVRYRPKFEIFKPVRIPMSNLDKLTLTLDEFEAIRLVDVENLKQQEAASNLGVSQATLSRILADARNKVGKVLTNGMALQMEGYQIDDEGTMKNYHFVSRHFKCNDCSKQWKLPFGTGRAFTCPKCNSHSIVRLKEEYFCENCKHLVEQAYGEGKPNTCPKCKSDSIIKVSK